MGRQPGEQSRVVGRGAGARATFGLAWSVCLPCVALASGSLQLASLNGRTLGQIFVEEDLITPSVPTATLCAVGTMGALHRPGSSIGWIFCAAALCQGLSNFGFEYATYGLLTRPGSLPLAAEASPFVLFLIANVIPPIMLRSGLFDIDLVINRALVYAALTSSLVLVYVGSVVSLQYGLRSVSGGSSQLAIVASTLVIAALFSPLRRRIQGFIDRRFYRKKYDARKTLASFSSRLRDETDLEALTGELVGVARRTMQPAHVSVWRRGPTSREGRGRDV